MSSVVRSVLGAALLLTGASAAMAQSYNAPAAQAPQTGVYTATAASNNAPVAAQAPQTGAYTATAASNNAPVAGQPQQSHHSSLCDNTDRYGGHGANSIWGIRAFWGAEGQSSD